MPLLNARELDPGSTIEVDVCIVGAGAAGIAIAREFAGRNERVALIESGDFEVRHRTQALYMGANVGLDSSSLGLSRFRVFGGTTTRWGGQCRPLDPIDFEERNSMPDSGWPLTRAELDGYYRRSQRTCNLGPYDYEPACWAAADRPTLPVDQQHLAVRIYQFSHPADFGQVYRDELIAADNVNVYLNANAVEILVGDGARAVSGLRIATLNERQHRVVAKAYVLACGGVENPRLMLASNSVVRTGLGNGRDLVGRYFMDHPYFWAGRFEPADSRFDQTLHVIEDYDRVGVDQKAHAALTLADPILRAEGLNGCAAYFARRPSFKTQAAYVSPGGRSLIHVVDVLKHEELPNRRFGRHLRNTVTGLGDVGRMLGHRLAEVVKPRFRLGVRMVLETTPHRDSRVMLDTRRDALGMPRAQVDWRLNDGDKRGLHRLAAVMQSEFARLGLGRLVFHLTEDDSGWPSSMASGKHHMGTTRMHVDPSRGVVDANCRVHELANLFVSGSSVFPTGGYANPTLTIVALAIRLADHLKERLRAGGF